MARAFMAIDSHIYGFTIQEAGLRASVAEPPTAADEIVARAGDEHTNLRDIAQAAAASPADFPAEFTFGLDLLLDGLDRRLAAAVAVDRERD